MLSSFFAKKKGKLTFFRWKFRRLNQLYRSCDSVVDWSTSGAGNPVARCYGVSGSSHFSSNQRCDWTCTCHLLCSFCVFSPDGSPYPSSISMWIVFFLLSLLHLKVKVDMDKTVNCVHEIPCKTCPLTNSGETKRQFKTHLTEHRTIKPESTSITRAKRRVTHRKKYIKNNLPSSETMSQGKPPRWMGRC